MADLTGLPEIWSYDIESYPNYWSCTVMLLSDRSRCYQFEISWRRNDWNKFMTWLRFVIKNKHEMVGYNNVLYDYPVIHSQLFTIKTPNALSFYRMTDHIIGSRGNPWEHSVYKPQVPQWDLYLIHHYNNRNRQVSLKAIEYWMQRKSIGDLPYPAGHPIPETGEAADSVLAYNKDDVDATAEFAEWSVDDIHLRVELMKENDRNNLRASNNGKIGEKIYIDLLGYNNCFYYEGSERKPVQTRMGKVKVSEILSDNISLENPAFAAIHEFYKSLTLTDTKGVFDPDELDLPDYLLPHMGKVYNQTQLKKIELARLINSDMPYEIPRGLGAWERRYRQDPVAAMVETTGSITKVNVVHDGVQYDFGTGGLHAVRKDYRVESGEGKLIFDWDFTAWYPSLSRFLKCRPRHFPADLWVEAGEEIWTRRQSFEKGTAGYAAYKEAGNIPYGHSADPYSPFKDKKYTLTICINGQLLLLTLIDMVVRAADVTVVQANTDGFTFVGNEEDSPIFESIIKDFEEKADHILRVEQEIYKEIYMRDVNNYIAVGYDGKVKSKGTYEKEKLPHKNASNKVSTLAVHAYLFDDIEIEDFIYGHKHLHDFTKMYAAKHGARAYINDVQQQKVLRYLCTTDGVEIVRKTRKQTARVEAQTLCTIYTEMPDDDYWPDNLNYQYYIDEAHKLLRW